MWLAFICNNCQMETILIFWYASQMHTYKFPWVLHRCWLALQRFEAFPISSLMGISKRWTQCCTRLTMPDIPTGRAIWSRLQASLALHGRMGQALPCMRGMCFQSTTPRWCTMGGTSWQAPRRSLPAGLMCLQVRACPYLAMKPEQPAVTCVE